MGNTDSYFVQLIGELQRRRVLRTAALYIVGAWLAMQVADVVFPALGISERALRFVLFGAIFGFPVALVFGWFYDLGAHGIRRTEAADVDASGGAQAFFAPNSKHRVWVTPAKRGNGNWKVAADQDEKTPARRHVAMTGFCSCKAGIHAIHGNNLGSAIETGSEKISGMFGIQSGLNSVSMA